MEKRVRSVTVVERRSGPGYRVVLCCMTQSGTPVLETLEQSFVSVESAERFAIDQLHVDAGQIRIKARQSA